MNNTREKILLLLLGGVALSLCYTPYQQRKALRGISKDWKKLDPKELREGVSYLYKLGFVDKEEEKKNTFRIFPTEKGRLRSLEITLNNIKNKKQKWDGKWRMVAFDIPEKFKNGRDALRHKLKKVGFCELQKSVLITPYNCKEEIMLLVKFFELRRYVRFGVLDYVDNEDYLRKYFKLT
jgi:DNA-binding transcriptional regulator PaaX